MVDDANRDFGLIRSFGIDDGQLDGLRLKDAFVLGYECAQIDHLIETEERGFERLMHSQNRERIESQLRKSGRNFRIDFMPDDQSESWLMLYVGETDTDS